MNIFRTSAQRCQNSLAVTVLLALGALGLLSRIGIAMISIGTNDITEWQIFAEAIDKHGVQFVYENDSNFNHPPIMGYMAKYGLQFSRASGIPFAFCFKLPGILAEFFTAALLWRIWSRSRGPLVGALAVAAFGWSLDSILVSGYHGNTDCLYTFLCLLSVYLIERELHVAGGLALAGAFNVKLIPILLIPALALQYRSWEKLGKFAAGVAAGLLPFSPFLIGSGARFYRSVIAYSSNVDRWGITWFLSESLRNPSLAPLAQKIARFYIPNGRYVVIGLILLLSVWARLSSKWTRYEIGAACAALFLVFTPGFGVQYTVFICPFLFAVSLKRAMLYSFLSGLFLFLVYLSFWTHHYPLYSLFRNVFPMPTPLFGLLAWVTLVQFLAHQVCRHPANNPQVTMET